MQLYRFITPKRAGKWYPDLATAQRHACEIGAGFLAELSGEFCAYRETRLEVAPLPGQSQGAMPSTLRRNASLS